MGTCLLCDIDELREAAEEGTPGKPRNPADIEIIKPHGLFKSFQRVNDIYNAENISRLKVK